MPYLSSINKTLGYTLFFALFITPATAHNIQVSKDIEQSDHQQGNLLAIASAVLGLGIVGIVVWRIIKR